MAGFAFKHKPEMVSNRNNKPPHEAVSLKLDPFDSDDESDLKQLISTTPTPIEETIDVDLYYTEGECYIYKRKGHRDGQPKTKECIIYDTVPNEVIAISTKRRTDKYYVECKKPLKGFVYLPDDIYIDDNINVSSDDESEQKEPDIQEYDNDDDNDEIMIKKTSSIFKRDYSKQKFIKLDEEPDEHNDPEYSEEKPEETRWNKIMTSNAVKKMILWFRSHPYIPGLIILLIQAGIEGLAIFDLYTDIVVTGELGESHNPILFGISAGLVAAPFIIAWTVASHTILSKYEKAHRKHKFEKCWSVFLGFYNIAPLGVVMIFLFEIYHWIETIIVIPIFWVCTGGLRHRKIGYQELGYYKLRKVSEVFAESLPQSVFQLCLLLGVFGETACSKCDEASVIQSLITSIIVLILWCTILFVEANKNGLSFGEYVAVTFQGSFDFVPYLPAIEKGVEIKGESVNWSNFKIRQGSFGQISKSVYSSQCRLKVLKVSQYTIHALSRFSCRFLGSRLKIMSIRNNLEIIVSRIEQELHDFFNRYDTDKSGSFDFIEFVKIYLSINSVVHERSIMNDIYEVWFKFVDKNTNQIWMLDLLFKAPQSIVYMPLIDYKSPLLYAYDTNNINFITFLISSNYHLTNKDHESEFNLCVIRAVTENKTKLAAVLCENIGVPIVFEAKSAEKLKYRKDDKNDDEGHMNPYLNVHILGQEKNSNICRETNNPIWNQHILFIIDFEVIHDILSDYIESKSIEFEKPDLMQFKSVQEFDEMELRKYANESYQRTKKMRESKHNNKGYQQLLNIDDDDDDEEKTKSAEIDENVVVKSLRNLYPQRQSSHFANYILQKEQGILIVGLTVYSKLYLEYNRNKGDDDNDDEEEKHSIISKEESIYEVEDKYIGKENVIINLKKDVSEYGNDFRIFSLKHSIKKRGKLIVSGNIKCKVYLNVLQVYHDAIAKSLEYKKQNKGNWKPMELIIDTNIFYRCDV